MIVSASSLVRHCGFQRKLNRDKPKSASAQEACDRGTKFHEAVEKWIQQRALSSLGTTPPLVDDPEIQGWLDLLACSSEVQPAANVETEIMWGLDHLGGYVRTVEAAPHVYEPAPGHGPLLTAGRADIAWERNGCVYVGDWKTGKWPTTPAEANLQVNAAGISLVSRTRSASYIPMIYYARDGFWDIGREVVIGSREWSSMLEDVRTAALLDETPRPGSHCSGCWSKKVCKFAQSKEVRV